MTNPTFAKAAIFTVLTTLSQVPLSTDADAQCDPGMPVSEILQSEMLVGYVARVEVSRTQYTEHWCLLPNFRHFGADRGTTNLTKTAFRNLTETFNQSGFTDRCRNRGGQYHVANVTQAF